jgi:hypothetical protein
MAESCKGKTKVPDPKNGTNQLKEITLTENPEPSKVVGVGHKASNLIL